MRMARAALLVEDNRSHAELVSEELESALPGWILDVAPTIAEARRKMASRAYDLFVFDYRLPDGDGIGLLREVRLTNQVTPALFVTTASSAKLAVEAMKLGADDYIVKEEGYLSVLPYLVHEVLRRRERDEENRVLQERLQRAELGATLGYLASGLAHHINNPLATIRTFLQLLPTHYEDPEFRGGYLATALSETERIRDLVRDIMRATTIPAKGREVHRLSEILARAEETIETGMAAKHLCYRRCVNEGLPEIRVHGEAATCLFVALLQNAVRFSPESGSIELSALLDKEGGRIVTTIRDYGPGIPPEHREKVFEPFFTTAVDGLGMGLFVASRIADLQGMALAYENCEPNGVAFTVGIPVSAVETDNP
jgi:signal transduction histidine kinase